MLKKDSDKLKKQLKEQENIAIQCEGKDTQFFHVPIDKNVIVDNDPLIIGLCNIKE